jgi:hypothetical protein
MKKLILVLVLTVFSFALLHADVYIKTNTHTDAFDMMGTKQPAKDEVSEQWIGKDKFANVSPQQTIVMDLGNKKMYFIYNTTKTYVEAALPLDITKLLPAQAAQMMSMMKITVKVSPTGETKKIGKWNCAGYDVNMDMTMMQMKMKTWTTTDVPFDWKSFSEKMMGSVRAATMPFLDEKSMAEFKKIKGFQVAVDISMSMMGQNMNSNTRVLDIDPNKEAPAGIYSVPAGYTKQDKLTMRQGM